MSGSTPFRFGVSEFTTWPWTFEEDVKNYAALDVDAIEVCEFKLDPARAIEQLASVAEHGLTISSVQPRLHSLYPDQPRPEPREPSDRMQMYRTTIDLFAAAAPDATLVTITGAAPNGNFREAFSTAVDQYRRLADYAADRGMRIALEPLNPILMNLDTFICTLPDALRIVDAVDRANFGVWLDVWHIWQDPDVARHIKACGDRIFGVHINDWHEPRNVGDRATIGKGVIPLADLLGVIRRAGYDGTYTLEIFSVESLDDSLWRSDLNQVIIENRTGFAQAWHQSRASTF